MAESAIHSGSSGKGADDFRHSLDEGIHPATKITGETTKQQSQEQADGDTSETDQ